MRKTIAISIVCLVLAISSTSTAGTLMAGAKGWYTWWDSALGDFAAKAADISLEEYIVEEGLGTFVDLNSDPKQGGGILAGPLLSYQTDDGNWSTSLAWMGFGSFSQDADITAAVDGTGHVASYDLDLNRSEIDLAVSRKITERFKVFLGCKYQTMKYTYEVTYEGLVFDVYKSEATMAIPTLGAGYFHPISDTMIIGIQGGLLLVTGTIGYNEELWPGYGGYEKFDPTVGFNGELTFSYMIKQKVMLQVGYRYQTMKLKAGFDTVENLDDTDTFHGVNLSAVYMFGL